MPSREAHVAAASANQATIEYLRADGDRHLPWIATVAFYKALHIVECLLAADPHAPVHHTDDHKARARVLRTTSRYQKIWSMYRPLYQASMVARYLRENDASPTHDVFAKYLPLAKVDSVILGHYLHQVQQSVATLLNDPDILKPPTESPS